MVILYLIPVFITVASTSASTTHSLTVKGKLMCGQSPATSKDTWVSLLNKNVGIDDKIEKAVDDNGNFSLTLTVSYGILSWFKPELHIHTNCNDKTLYGTIGKPCQRKWSLSIPTNYVDSSTPFDLGVQSIEAKVRHEERSCKILWPNADNKIVPTDAPVDPKRGRGKNDRQ